MLCGPESIADINMDEDIENHMFLKLSTIIIRKLYRIDQNSAKLKKTADIYYVSNGLQRRLI